MADRGGRTGNEAEGIASIGALGFTPLSPTYLDREASAIGVRRI